MLEHYNINLLLFRPALLIHTTMREWRRCDSQCSILKLYYNSKLHNIQLITRFEHSYDLSLNVLGVPNRLSSFCMIVIKSGWRLEWSWKYCLWIVVNSYQRDIEFRLFTKDTYDSNLRGKLFYYKIFHALCSLFAFL